MRYSCPSCNRVFYLDTQTVSPCPACGTILAVDGEEGAGQQQAKQEEQTDAPETMGAAWLEGVDAGAAPGPSAAPPPPAQTTGPQPTAWFATPPPPAPAAPARETASPRLPPAAPAEEEFGLPSNQPTIGPVTRRMPAARGPSGTRIFLVTSAVVIVLGGVAAAVVVFFLPEQTGRPVATGKGDARIKELEGQLRRLGKEKEDVDSRLVAANGELLDVKERNNSLALELEEARRDLEKLRSRGEVQAKATEIALDGLMLVERRADLAKAQKLADEAIRLDPGLSLAYRVKGRALAASGLPKEAVGAFEQADHVSRKAGGKGDPKALVLAAEVAGSDIGDEKRARALLGRAAAVAPGSAAALAAEARRLQLEGQLAPALEKATEAAKADATMPLAPLVRGEVLLARAMDAEELPERQKLFAQADEHLAGALKLDPQSARANLSRGRLLLERSRHIQGFGFARLRTQSEAERHLSAAARLTPKASDAHLALAELRLADGALQDTGQALIRAQEAVRLTDGKDAPALAVLARAQAANGEPSDAVQSMDRAIRLDPTNDEYQRARQRYKRDADRIRR